MDSIDEMPPDVFMDIVEMYINAVREGCDLIFSTCVAISTVCDNMQDFSELIDIPIISIESGQCNKAIKIGRKIGVLGTISTSMEIVKKKIEKLQSEQQRI